MSNICPLCGSVDVSNRETIKVLRLISFMHEIFDMPCALKAHSLDYCVCKQCGLGFSRR